MGTSRGSVLAKGVILIVREYLDMCPRMRRPAQRRMHLDSMSFERHGRGLCRFRWSSESCKRIYVRVTARSCRRQRFKENWAACQDCR